MKKSFARIVIVIIIGLFTACQRGQSAGESIITKSDQPLSISVSPTSPVITLPAPNLKGTMSLEEAINKRRSMREFDDQPLTEAEIGQLLWSAQGITNPAGLRTAPSAGALYPLEVYILTAEGFFHYKPQGHQLILLNQNDLRPMLYQAALYQGAISTAPAIYVITAVYERTTKKYGEERSPRYVHLEAGHAAQNLLLQAVALDLGSVPIGAFNDDKVIEVLELPPDTQPLYLIPVGHPRD